MRAAIAALVLAAISAVIVSLGNLHDRALVLEQQVEQVQQLDMIEPLHFSGSLSDGTWFVVIQNPGETIDSLIGRYTRIQKTGKVPVGSPKVESWTDAAGRTHQVILAQDPTWSEAQWCKVFDNAVAKLQEAFPCD